MNRHPTDQEILDALAPGAEPAPGLRDHLATCPECRARVEAEGPLQRRLETLPRESDPPRDLWPGVLARIDAESRESRGPIAPTRSALGAGSALRAAAAIAIFVAGAALGRALAPGAPDADPAALDDPLVAAAEVQRAGTAWVEAVARFRATADDASGPVVIQAWDVALAAVHGAAWELERLRPEDPTAGRIVALAGRSRLGEVSP